LARLTPELLDLHPGLPEPGPGTGPAARQRLFEAVARFLVERWGPAWAQDAGLVGIGAFLLEAWRRGEGMELRRNPEYHGRFTGNLQRVILLPVQDWETRLRWYEKDALDILGVTYLAAEEREEVRQRYASEYIAWPRLETHFPGLRCHPPALRRCAGAAGLCPGQRSGGAGRCGAARLHGPGQRRIDAAGHAGPYRWRRPAL